MSEISQSAAVLGGQEIVINRIDGVSEKVFVRQLPFRLFPALMSAMDDEPAMVELFTDRAKGWSDTLSPESFEAVVETGEKVNADFFGRWKARKLNRMQSLVEASPVFAAALLGQRPEPESKAPPNPSPRRPAAAG